MGHKRVLLLGLVLTVGLIATIASPALARYRVVTVIGTRGGGMNQYNDPSGLTLDGHAHLFVADTLNNRIVKLDATDGDYQNDWSRSGDLLYTTLSKPRTVSADEDGDVWVVDSSPLVQVFDPNGRYVGKLSLHGPGAVLSATADLHGHVLVTRFDDIDGDNALFVPGFRGYGETYATAGPFLSNRGIGPNHADGGVAFGANHHMYALDRVANSVIDVDLTGATPNSTWVHPVGASPYNQPAAVDVDRFGFVYVAEYGGQRVDKMTPDGVLVATLRAKRGSRGPFTPAGVAVADGGAVWVSDATNDRLVEFKPTTPETILDIRAGGLTTNTRTPKIHVSSDAKGARFRCTVDGARPQRCAPDGVVHLHFTTDGRHRLTVRAIDRHGVRDPTPARATIDVDTSPPVITSTTYRLEVDTPIIVNGGYPDGGIPLSVSWLGRDDQTKGHKLQYELLARYAATGPSAPFAPFSTSEQFNPSTRRDTYLAAGVKTEFRVAARDLAGNVGERDIAPPADVSVHQDSDQAVTYEGKTQPIDTTTYPGAWGGTARTLKPGAKAHLSFDGHGVEIVMRKQDAPARRARICLLEAPGGCKLVDLGGGAADRQVVFGRALVQGHHTITVTAIDEVTLDAFAVLTGE